MGLIRAYISDELEDKLRNYLPAKKGALSEFVEEAIREKLERLGVEI